MKVTNEYPIGSHELPGWDTVLARPFDLVAALPPIFQASNRSEAFSATERNRKYWLIREDSDKLWLYSLDHSGQRISRHYFQLDWLLHGSSIYRAIVSLTELIKSRKQAGKLTLDIFGFKQDLYALRSTIALVRPAAVSQLTPLDAAVLEYFCLVLGIDGEARLYFHENVELHASNGRYRFPRPFPDAFNWIRPTLEVWQHDRGNLFDLRSPFIKIGPVAGLSSVVEQMKAFRRLFDVGLTDEMAKSLDHYAGLLRRL